MRFLSIIIIYLSIIYSIDNTYSNITYGSTNLNNNNQLIKNNNLKNYDQILDNFIDIDKYNIGPGDVFLFNMITTNGVITLELLVSPSGDVLIPIVGKVNLRGEKLKSGYKIIIDKCKEKYEDAFVYINLIKLRQFKVLVSGDFINAGMYSVSSSNRVSDLIESIMNVNDYSDSDSLLYSELSKYPKNIMFNKDIFLIRDNVTIDVNLFDYYINSNFEFNPYLQEGDIIKIKASKKIAILGEIKYPIRIDKKENITYRKVLEDANVDISNSDFSRIKVINYNMLKNYSSVVIDRISDIESRYRSDFDESFLSSRIKHKKGILHINNKKALNKWLDLKVSDADIIMIPNKVEYVEIIGAVNNPGSYKLNSKFSVLDYLNNAGGASYNAKNENIYVIDDISGIKIKVEHSYKPIAGDLIFIEEKIGYKNWQRFTESVKLAGTLSTMIASIVNMFWIIDRIQSGD